MISLETLFQDLRYGARTLVRNPGFTVVSVFALALGIGVNVVVFTAYKAFVARPPDARDPGTMVNFSPHLESGVNNAKFSYRITRLIAATCVRSAVSSRLRLTSCALPMPAA